MQLAWSLYEYTTISMETIHNLWLDSNPVVRDVRKRLLNMMPDRVKVENPNSIIDKNASNWYDRLCVWSVASIEDNGAFKNISLAFLASRISCRCGPGFESLRSERLRRIKFCLRLQQVLYRKLLRLTHSLEPPLTHLAQPNLTALSEVKFFTGAFCDYFLFMPKKLTQI